VREDESNAKEWKINSDLNNLIDRGWTKTTRINTRFRSKDSHREREREREDELNPKEWTRDTNLNNPIEKENESDPKEWTSDSDLNNIRNGERFKGWYQPLQDFRSTWSISKSIPCQFKKPYIYHEVWNLRSDGAIFGNF
jgi:hypothetical protein